MTATVSTHGQDAGHAPSVPLTRATAESAKPSPALRVTQALARLQSSRAAMRLELLPPEKADESSAAHHPGWQRLWRPLRRWARRSAAVAVLVRTVEQTWRVHPLRPVGEALVDSYRAQVVPLMRKHPWGAMAVAAGLGAALVASRQWHWPLVTSSLRPLPMRLSRWVVSQLSSAPMQAILASWFLMAATTKPSAEAATETGAAPAVDS